MDYRDFMKRIGDKIGEAKGADRIEEISWLNIVVKEVKRYIERLCETIAERDRKCMEEAFLHIRSNEAPTARLLA